MTTVTERVQTRDGTTEIDDDEKKCGERVGAKVRQRFFGRAYSSPAGHSS